jgi:hypothetical protein
MSFFQRFFTAVFPKRWMEAMEADSRLWIVRCSCGFTRSVWEMGGIRYKAIGEPRWYMKCSQCGKRSWHKVSYEPPHKS